MGLLIWIIGAVLVAVLLAYVVVKYLPLKLRWIASLLLLLLSIFLVFKIYNGVMGPIEFNKDKKVKFAKVINSLKIIRDAQLAHYEVNGTYAKDKNALIQFIDTAQFAVTETKNVVETINTGGGITKEVEKKVTDTIGYKPVVKDFDGKDYKNMFKVPGVAGKEFDLTVGMVEKVAGLKVPTFEAKTDKASILKGMDPSLVKQELEAIVADEIKGEFVSVGSLEEVSTGGNWPPSYDKASAKKDE
ncbi:hypothetical protein OD91_2564 [Lutibacter sp. Hel_I_33_5]|uniref:hypothetical protein n=1 Tax=Lutibacter sp. Hel_I_33_5 TaxID=1566289 RepID=UPI0011A28FB0|nr:hypothetical protein [Lutibacter sp. Hel_I_33_5]TVZ57246.1 hypothetical protein OD91_2564 [Lutibacter sp. Hel_I_33_5]